MQIAVSEKLEGLGYVFAEVEADIKKIAEEKQHLDYCRKVLENKLKRLKNSAIDMLDANDLTEIKAGRFNAKICTSGGIQALEVNEQLVPDNYRKIIYEVDIINQIFRYDTYKRQSCNEVRKKRPLLL